MGALPEPASEHESSTVRFVGRATEPDDAVEDVVEPDGDRLDDDPVQAAAKSSTALHATALTNH